MPIAEQLTIKCVEFFSAWNGLVSKASTLPRDQPQEFIAVATQIGLLEKISRMKEICERPEEAIVGDVDTEKLFSDASVDLVILDQALDTSLRLGVDIRDAVRATAENEKDRLTQEQEERTREANVGFVLPVVLTVVGVIFTTLLGAAIERSVR